MVIINIAIICNYKCENFCLTPLRAVRQAKRCAIGGAIRGSEWGGGGFFESAPFSRISPKVL
jgi:hypothetical protein